MEVICVGDGRDGCGWGVAALVMLLLLVAVLAVALEGGCSGGVATPQP